MNTALAGGRAFPHGGVAVYAVGFLLLVVGGLLLSPMLYLVFDPSELKWAKVFLVPAVPVSAVGLLMVLLSRRRRHGQVTVRLGAMIVVAGWLVAFVSSVYPICRLAGLSFSQGMFEAVSGWTTTGLSVVDVDAAPRILLVWRSTMQLAGGAGLAIIMLAVFSLPVGAGLYRAEGRNDQLAPHVLASTKLVLLLYSVYVTSGTVAYRLSGMAWFDAVNHAFCAVSTGGFSTRAQSIGYWNSPAVEAVSLPLMLLGNMNFVTAYLLFRGKLRPFGRNGEVRTAFVLLAAGCCVLFFVGTGSLYPSVDRRVRVAVFETVTALTTTGYSTVGYTAWPGAGFLVLLVLMLVGGGSCSTAGGIKQLRILILFKEALWEIRRSLLPRRVVGRARVYHTEDRLFLTDRMVSSVGSYVFLYLGVWLVGSIVMASFGYPLRDSLFEFASSVGTVGLSVGITGPDTHVVILWLEMVGMVLGRLEFFVVFVAIGGVARGLGAVSRKPARR